MIEKTIITSQQNKYQLTSDSKLVVDWFNDSENQTETILNQINNERMYDPIFQGSTDMTVIDLGANIGLFSLYASDSSARIIAVEAVPDTFAVLSELTKDHNNITKLNLAVSNTNDKITFYLNENSTTNSMVSHKGKPIEVQGVTIADLIAQQQLTNVDFVKCDIEGSEMMAITDDTIAPVKDIVQFWFVELHQTDNDTAVWPGNLESNRQQLKAIFERNGYTTESVIHDQLFAWKE